MCLPQTSEDSFPRITKMDSFISGNGFSDQKSKSLLAEEDLAIEEEGAEEEAEEVVEEADSIKDTKARE